MTQLAFHVDLDACSGCKTCQVACQDRHDLEPYRRFRRVIDVEGGHWTDRGGVWETGVVAYSISTSCMHCQLPACVDACPTAAMTKGADGAVAIDPERCIGCRYCEWACPYGALSYDQRAGRMAKCDFCRDDLERGQPPACVASCPMRALDFGDLEELRERFGTADLVWPLPDASLTRPSLVVTPHRHLALGPTAPQIANREEI